jgi:hypothetical protein
MHEYRHASEIVDAKVLDLLLIKQISEIAKC